MLSHSLASHASHYAIKSSGRDTHPLMRTTVVFLVRLGWSTIRRLDRPFPSELTDALAKEEDGKPK